jgi:uncharacterized protein (DUF924 family)
LNREAEAILDFWLGNNTEIKGAKSRSRLWFAASASTDSDIKQRFADSLERAIAGQLDHWRDTSRGTLALVVLLDQFSRNIFRGTVRAFAQDDMALALATDAIAKELDRDLDHIERAFLYMPFQHAEDEHAQDRSVTLYRELDARAQEPFRKATANFLQYAQEHRAIVARFGRFPHRNAILGRDSTPEEAAFLASNERDYGQSVEHS